MNEQIKAEFEAQVRIIGKAFNALPSHEARLDVLGALTSIMRQRAEDSRRGLIFDWLDTAHASLTMSGRLWGTKPHDKV